MLERILARKHGPPVENAVAALLFKIHYPIISIYPAPPIYKSAAIAGTSWGAWVDVSSYTPTVSGADSGGIIWKSGEYGLRTQSGGTFVAYVYTSSGLEGISVAGYATGTWYYVMATYTTSPSNTLSLYINGALVVQNTAIPGSISATGNALVIGQQPGDGPFQGTIDDVAIYNTAETLANINAIYTQNPEAIGYQVTLNSVAIFR